MSDWVNSEVVYLHIPKTGGTWVRQVLRESGITKRKSGKFTKHANFDFLSGLDMTHQNRLKSLVTGKSLKPKKFFCVVRHPLLWYQSFFQYQLDKGWPQWGEIGNINPRRWNSLCSLNMPRTDDFNEYMKCVNKDHPGYLTYLFHSYIYPSGARWLKNEQLRDDLLLLNSEWGLGLDENAIKKHKAANTSTKIELEWSEENLVNTMKNEAALLAKYDYTEDGESLVNVR